ncbi:MAG: hypothetical protein RL129_988 [Actinomycetota bacterium]|jgi:DNA-binding NarL/FixJ family response regulator
MKPLRVILVEDDSFVRATLKAAIQLQGIEVIHDTSNVASAMKIARSARPDAAIVDLDLGRGPNGIDLAIGLRNVVPEIGIVLLTGFIDPRLLNPEIGKLPRGSKYLVKQRLSDVEVLYETVLDAIAGVKNGESRKDVRIPTLNLPSAQLETLRLIALGFSNDRIARERGITEKSVEQSISRLVQHFNIAESDQNKRVELARIYFKASGSNHGAVTHDAL